MKLIRILAPAVVLHAALLTGAAHAAPAPQGYSQGGWDVPPSEYNDDFHRHAFHDGIEAARRDFAARLPPDPNRHEEYRHPMMPDPTQRVYYRDAYKRGYFLAVEHMRNGGDAPPPPPPAAYAGGWDVPPSEYNDDFHRQAFHDGIEAARRDFAAQLPPDPARHQEFQHPQVPFPAREGYRDAYKRGYFVAVSHIRNGGPR